MVKVFGPRYVFISVGNDASCITGATSEHISTGISCRLQDTVTDYQ